MIRQTVAIFHDSYRELNARKLFWVSLALSGLLVASFAATGLNSKGVTFLWWELPFPIDLSWLSAEVFYKIIFIEGGIKIWLAWIAMGLGLISTASIIPEFVASGSIELSLSRPISRARLFLTKYCAALLFAGLQVAVFSLASFLVIGLRGHAWEPRVFLAIPIVVLVFSYLYCISAIVGLMTRSTIFSLIAAAMFWLLLFTLNAADALSLRGEKQNEVRIASIEKSLPKMESFARSTIKTQVESGDAQLISLYSDAAKQGNPAAEDLVKANPILKQKRADLEARQSSAATFRHWNQGFLVAKTLLPKTTETTELLNRSLLSEEDMKRFNLAGGSEEPPDSGDDSVDTPQGRRGPNRELERQTGAKMDEAIRSRSLWYVIGGSLAFEAVILSLATWIFCRRDF